MNHDHYPIHAFPEIIANAIQKSAYYHNIPISVAAQSYLGEMAYIAQDKINAPSDKCDTGQPASLFLLTIFPSGEGKDICKNDASKISKEKEAQNIKNHLVDLDIWKSLPSKERGEKPQNPISIFKKATIQGIINVMSLSNCNSFCWCTCEGGYLFSGYSLKSDTVGEAISVCNDLVDTGQANAVLKNDNDSRLVVNKRFSIDISVQDVVARPALNNPLLREQGFLARALFASPAPLPYKLLTEESKSCKSYDDIDLVKYWQLCDRLITTKINNNSNLVFDDKNRYLIIKSADAELLHINHEN